MIDLIIPLFIIAVTVYSAIKKVKPFETFIEGAKGAIPLCVSLFPYLTAIFVLVEIFRESGLSDLVGKVLSPVFGFFGIPTELSELILLKPLSGGGSLALLTAVYESYGIDSYLSLTASCIYGSSETLFYVVATYFTNVKNKKLIGVIIISLVATFISTVFCCFICKLFV